MIASIHNYSLSVQSIEWTYIVLLIMLFPLSSLLRELSPILSLPLVGDIISEWFSTEKIGCVSDSPAARRKVATQYSNNQYGYSPSNAPYKFVRMRLNNGILPLNTIRGGACKVRGRTDGLCPLSNFVRSQAKASEMANYQFLCFGNFTYNKDQFTGDGTYGIPS
jgi:hypothetical protein